MAIRIYEQDSVQDILLRLTETEFGIMLSVVDEKGDTVECGCMANITPKGIELRPAFNPNLGIAVDGDRKVEII
jgi:hypothetical protein